MGTYEQQLEQLASNLDNWTTQGIPQLSSATDALQRRLDETIRTLVDQWQGDAADLALERLRVLRRNLNRFRSALEGSALLMTGINQSVCAVGSDNETRQTEANTRLYSLPGKVIPSWVHNALAEGEPFTFMGLEIDLNRGAEQVEGMLSNSREEAARQAVNEVDSIVKQLPNQHAKLYENIEWEDMPTSDGTSEPVFPGGGPTLPVLPGGPGMPDAGGPGALPEVPGSDFDFGTPDLPALPGGPDTPGDDGYDGDLGNLPYPGYPGDGSTGPGNGSGSEDGTGSGPSIDSGLATGTLPGGHGGAGMGIGLGGVALGAGALTARYGSSAFGIGAPGLGIGLPGAGGGGAGGLGAGGSAGGARGAGGLLGGGAGGSAASGSGASGAGGRGMGMVGGMGANGASDKKSRRSGMGYVAPHIGDEGDGGPAAEASRAGRRRDAATD